KDAFCDALMAFGEAVTGVPGFLICNRFVVHHGTRATPIVCGKGTVIEPARLVDYPDLVVSHLGLRIGRVSAPEPDGFRASLAVLAIRLGMLSRMLDMAYGHLKERLSFGRKTLSHQLVKATFAEVHGAVIRLRGELDLRAHRSLSVGLVDDHCLVTEFN